MARVIPSALDDAAPPGERALFTLLAAGPDEWVVLHSLDLAPWHRNIRTEIDFLVVAPSTGILCVEVKSHERISFRDDKWSPPSIARSPFKQAADARYTLARRLSDLAPTLKSVPVVHCCIFTRAYFDVPPNLSIQPWELMDGRAFGSLRSGTELCTRLETLMRQSIQADAALRPLRQQLSAAQLEEIVRICHPVQMDRPDAREERLRREQELERILRDQQKPVLLLCQLNQRVVVSGPAGTGKTLIAMEVARRAAERKERVALVCYNQLVGEWMKGEISRFGFEAPNLVVDRVLRLMAGMADISIPAAPTGDFWNTQLLDKIEERLTDPDFSASAVFDYLVLDEAQDVLARPRIWTCLTQFLAGGTEQGRFVLFGDFDTQVVSDREAMLNSLKALSVPTPPTQWRLTENCRNYRIIGETAVRLSGFKPPVYSGYMRSGGSVNDFDIRFYDTEEEQLVMLRQVLSELKGHRYRPSDIVALSFCAPEVSAGASLMRAAQGLVPAWAGRGGVRYTSIQGFKGMEAKAVILTDAALGQAEFHRDLFYIGMTRATEIVRVLCSRQSQQILSDWISGRAGE